MFETERLRLFMFSGLKTRNFFVAPSLTVHDQGSQSGGNCPFSLSFVGNVWVSVGVGWKNDLGWARAWERRRGLVGQIEVQMACLM